MDVLIIDDNPIEREILSAFVRKAGYHPITADGAEQALALLSKRETPPEIIVIDWMMPEIDGLQLCAEIRKQERIPRPYIIMVTSSHQENIELTALDLGADDFIEKPVNGSLFMARLKVGKRLVDAQKKYIQLAHTDELTGLLNRRAGLNDVDNHIARLFRASPNTEHCLIMCDIDHFKKVNDNYGHSVGDELLLMVAKTLKNLVRPFETVARLGGEEFLIYCEANRHEIEVILQRLLKAIRSLVIHHEMELVSATMSFGCLVINNQLPRFSTDKYLTLADDLLYRVKNNGRNAFAIRAINKEGQLAPE
ncbi:diguanylate cyclase [Methylophaga sp. OBS3]|uniref:GGDEF domain-containing response regulator n=1 Tax=Methylophaga sp. OBS3 TaxID=2991934 RepID=UPI002257EE9F|nr:diguanylate cyclase [Methylophaga sp. OBS3]MCX4189246.1 diguanylate cyclase [Methylophaga sp. OBS3]